MILPAWVSKYNRIRFNDFNCWQLVCKIYREQFSIHLPSYDNDYKDADDLDNIQVLTERESKTEWAQVQKPNVGDLVLLRIKDIPCHIGVCVDPHKHLMIHVMKDVDVTIEDYSLPKWVNRKPEFFRHVR